jgi:IS4 transposase
VLVFTTRLRGSTTEVLELCRRRWQIELLFKRLKSLALIGHVPKHDPRSSRAWLYGKLLVALLAEKLTRIGRDISPQSSAIPS